MQIVACLLVFFRNFVFSGATTYSPDWDSLDTRPLPSWYDNDKFGIFMHWGVYSVPSYGTEWFWINWEGEKVPKYVNFMKKNFKPGFKYPEFAPMFTAELFNATEFAELVKKSGARYYVLTSKHHEGYTLWPSNYSWNWNSWDVGPHRDLVEELALAIRAQGVRFGLYYSLMVWFHSLYLRDKNNHFKSQEYVQEVVWPQMKEIITKYRPEVLWSDGDWEPTYKYWNSTDFIAWLYNESPVKDTIVTNDRWGIGTTCQHGDFYTCSDRYSPGVLQKHKWENCMTIDRDSWGYRREATLADILSIEQIIEELASTISCGGNLLMNVGPTHYGMITPIYEERLTQIGEWLQINGEAVYESKPWIYQNDTQTPDIWYTSKLRTSDLLPPNRLYNPQKKEDTIVYAFVFKWPDNNTLDLGAPKLTNQTRVSMLGYKGLLAVKTGWWSTPADGVTIDLSSIQWTRLPSLWAWVLRIEYLDTDSRAPYIDEKTPKN